MAQVERLKLFTPWLFKEKKKAVRSSHTGSNGIG